MIWPVLQELVRAGLTGDALVNAIRNIEESSPLPERSAGAIRQERYRSRGGDAIPHDLRMAIFDRDGWACLECGYDGEDLCCDHVVPVSKGGGTSEDNLQTLCRPCNSRKKDRTRKYVQRHESPRMSADKTECNGQNGTERSSSSKEVLLIEEEKKEIAVSPSSPRKSEGHSRGTKMPADWKPSRKVIDYGRSLGYVETQISEQMEDLRNWALANSNRAVARKANWDLTAIGWIKRNRPKDMKPPPPPPDPNLPPMHLRPPWMLEGITEEAWEARRMEMIKGLKNGHDKKPEVRGNPAVGQGGRNDAPKLRFEG